MFTPLTKENVYEIVGIQIRSLTKMLAENGIELQVTPKDAGWLARQGYDPMYGARPVKRTIQRYIVNDLSKKILAGDVEEGRPIVIDAAKRYADLQELTVTTRTLPAESETTGNPLRTNFRPEFFDNRLPNKKLYSTNTISGYFVYLL